MIPKSSSAISAVLDACVVAPMPLCDTLLRCAEEPALFRVLWSSETLEEVRRTRVRFGYSRRQADRRLRVMTSAFPGASVRVSPRLSRQAPELPDPKDAHVVLAAQRESAQIIVTFNLRHFPRSALGPLGVEAWSPDEFLFFLLKKNRTRILEVLDAQASAIGQTRSAVLDRFRSGLPRFARAAAEEPM
ncbi:MAG: PIN domain-containing protein [Terracidiphilus sp.]